MILFKKDIVKKDVYNAQIKNIKDKIPDITNLANKTTLNAKTNQIKGGIPSITNLATKTAFNAVENKIPSVSNFVKKTEYTTKINKIKKKITDHNHHKYITAPEFDKLTSENFAAILKSDSNLPKKITICFNDNLSKMMKSVFYFILKALFLLKIFKFLS